MNRNSPLDCVPPATSPKLTVPPRLVALAIMLVFGSLVALSPVSATPQDVNTEAETAEPPQTAGYDPAADPFAEFEAAKAEAASSGRNILLEIGGEWCGWCHLLEKFLAKEEDIAAKWDEGFVTLKVNYSPENENQEFLSQFPEVEGYPHLFVLDAEGKLLHSQNTGALEQGRGYSRTLVAAFLDSWSPASP